MFSKEVPITIKSNIIDSAVKEAANALKRGKPKDLDKAAETIRIATLSLFHQSIHPDLTDYEAVTETTEQNQGGAIMYEQFDDAETIANTGMVLAAKLKHS